MKTTRTLMAGLLCSSLLFTACLSKLTNTDYNNEVVDQITLSSNAIDVTLDAYDASIPVEVGPDEYINTVMMESSYHEALEHLMVVATETMDLESIDADQQEAVREQLDGYYSATMDYLNFYAVILDYYTGDFGSDLAKVSEYDDEIYIYYNGHVDAHNALADALDAN